MSLPGAGLGKRQVDRVGCPLRGAARLNTDSMAANAPPTLDDAVFQRNLTALDASQPQVAAQIRSTVVPPGVRLAHGRDGSVTFRIAQDDGTVWLGGSSMPTVSSPAVLSHFAPGRANVLLATLGHGGEAEVLLRQLEPQQAVYAWDVDPLVPALALRRCDFSRDIGRGRLLLALGSELESALQRCFDDHPTHLPPARIFVAPQLEAADVHVLHSQAEAAAIRRHGRLDREVGEVGQRLQTRRGVNPGRRIAIVSMMIDPEVTRVAHALARAAESLGLDAGVVVVDRPAHGHRLAAARHLDERAPSDVILLNQLPGEWGELLSGVPRCVTWCVSAGACRPDATWRPAVPDGVWTVRPEFVPVPQASILGVAADSSCFHLRQPSDQELAHYGADVAVIMDAADLSADALGLKWESHRRLWEAIIQTLRRRPLLLDQPAALALIARVGRAADVALDSDSVGGYLASRISQVVAPTLAVLALLRSQRSSQASIRLWGANWESHPESAAARCGPRPTDEQRNHIYNTSGVILHVLNDDRCEQQLLDALAAEACVVRHQCRPAGPAGLPSFSQTHEIAALLADLPANLPHLRAQCKPAHEFVKQHGLFEHRLCELLAPGLKIH